MEVWLGGGWSDGVVIVSGVSLVVMILIIRHVGLLFVWGGVVASGRGIDSGIYLPKAV